MIYRFIPPYAHFYVSQFLVFSMILGSIPGDAMLGESSHSGGGRIKFFQDDVIFFETKKKKFHEKSFPGI